MVAEERDLHVVVSEIYAVALEANGLDKLAALIAEALGARSGLLALLDRPEPGQCALPAIVGLPSATENFDGWARTAYAEHYHQCNLWFERGIKRGFPAIVLSQELADPNELVRSEWYEYCRKLDTFHVLGAQFHVNGQFSGQFGAQRPRRAKSFDEASRRKMSLLLPHLQRALQIQLRLGLYEQLQAVTLHFLERVGLGVLILDEAKRLLFANRLAEHVLEEENGLRLSKGRLRVPAKSARSFDHLVDEAVRTSSGNGVGAGGMLNVPVRGGEALRVFISPLPRDRVAFGLAAPTVLVLLGDPDTAAPTPADGLRQAFSLTRAEARLLTALLSGERLSHYADRVGISIGTGRTHLKHLLAKTGHHRQVDLVRAVFTDPVLRFGSGTLSARRQAHKELSAGASTE